MSRVLKTGSSSYGLHSLTSPGERDEEVERSIDPNQHPYRRKLPQNPTTPFKMSAKKVEGTNGKKPASAATNLIGKSKSAELLESRCHAHANSYFTAGGTAGMMEALVCHPLGMHSVLLI